jgi:hypothetical protein
LLEKKRHPSDLLCLLLFDEGVSFWNRKERIFYEFFSAMSPTMGNLKSSH